jgi:hypothetical protein
MSLKKKGIDIPTRESKVISENQKNLKLNKSETKAQ